MEHILNLNAIVGIKLTPKGVELLAEEYPIAVKPDEDGYYQFPLWEVMGIFGQFMQTPNVQAGGTLKEMAIKIRHEDLK